MTVKSMVLILEEKSVVVDSLLMMLFSLLQVQKNLEKLLKKVHRWANLNEMTFSIEKMCNYGYKTNELPISSKL